MFDYSRLTEFADQYADAYARNAPFPFAVVDGVFEHERAKRMAQSFPSPADQQWYKYNNVFEKKLITGKFERLPSDFQLLLYEASGSRFVSFLEKLTGVSGLIPDPHHTGGGLHQIERGGKLDVHADFNWNSRLKLDRRVNVLLYFNDEWQDAWGGALELWDSSMVAAMHKISPTLNRMVVFNTSDTSYHGHPDPLTCPEGVTRKSVALYYYTNGRPESEKTQSHSTLYQKRPQDELNSQTEALREQRGRGKLT